MSEIIAPVAMILVAIAWGVSARFAPGVTADVTAFILRSPATLIHEASHAVAATVTGGFATGMRMQSPVSADVRSIHFTLLSRLITPAVGYVSTSLFGLACVASGVFITSPEFAIAPYAATGLVGFLCLLLSRNLMALAASIWMIVLSYVLMQTMWIPGQWFGAGIVAIGAIESLRLLILHIRRGWEIESDATVLSWGIIHPAIHAVVWSTVSVGCVFAAVAMLTV